MALEIRDEKDNDLKIVMPAIPNAKQRSQRGVTLRHMVDGPWGAGGMGEKKEHEADT
jgi:hypothetical protein